MYNFFRSWCERLLRIPDVPEPPPGDEASTRLFRAAPNFYKYLMFEWAAGTIALVTVLLLVEVVLLAGIFALVRERGIDLLLFALLALILAVALLARIFALALVRLDFEKRWYLVTDRSLRVREGILNVREMTITFANIQNVAISQGPIQRAIGIADLRVDTAGGSSNSGDKKFAGENLHTVRFRGVNNADEIRALITTRLAELRDSGLGDHEEPSGPSADVGDSSQVLMVLREIHVEAMALRETVSRAA